VAIDVRTYCVPEDREATTNSPTHNLYAQEQNVARIAAGLPPKQQSQATPAFGNMVNCPNCGFRTNRSNIFLNYFGTGYVCTRCG